MRNSLEHQLHRLFGGTDYAGLMITVGILAIGIGIFLVEVHLTKKKKWYRKLYRINVIKM